MLAAEFMYTVVEPFVENRMAIEDNDNASGQVQVCAHCGSVAEQLSELWLLRLMQEAEYANTVVAGIAAEIAAAVA